MPPVTIPTLTSPHSPFAPCRSLPLSDLTPFHPPHPIPHPTPSHPIRPHHTPPHPNPTPSHPTLPDSILPDPFPSNPAPPRPYLTPPLHPTPPYSTPSHPAWKVGAVIGEAGRTINWIRSCSGADIQIEQFDGDGLSTQRKMVIVGTEENCMQVVRSR